MDSLINRIPISDMENSQNTDICPSSVERSEHCETGKNIEAERLVSSKDKFHHVVDEKDSISTENANSIELPINKSVKEESKKSCDYEVPILQSDYIEQSNEDNEIIIKMEEEVSENGEDEDNVTEMKIEIERSVGIEVLSNYLGIRPNNMDNPESILPINNPQTSEEGYQFNSMPTTHQDAFSLLEATQESAFREINKPTYNCTKCTAILHTVATYKLHMAKHTKEERKELCRVRRNETMKRQRELNGNQPFKCEECGKAYLFETGLKTHITKYHKPVVPKDEAQEYPCPCGKVFTRKSRMETCYKEHSIQLQRDLLPRCARCKQHFRNQNELAYHKKLAHWPKRYLCKFCPMEYQTLKELFDHLELHRNSQVQEYKFITDIVEGKQDLKCVLCEKVSSDILELKSHILDDHKESYSCIQCDETFMEFKDFISHTRTSHPDLGQNSLFDYLEASIALIDSWRCDACNVQYETPEQMADHYIQHRYMNVVKLTVPKQEEEQVPEWKFQCKDCKRLFWTMIKLKRHKIRNHDIFGPYTESVLVSNLSFVCIHCRKQCENKIALDNHMQLHSGDRKYVCKYCSFRFSTLEKKVAHESIHTGDERYVCFVCEYKCDTEERWKQHKSSERHIDMKNSLLNGTFFQPKPDIAEVIIKQEIMDYDDEDHDDNDDDDDDGDDGNDEEQNEEQCQRKGSIDNENLEKCEVCGENFRNAEELSEHKKTHPFITVVEDAKATIFFN